MAQQGTAVSVYYHPNSASDAGPTASSAPASFTCDFDTAQVKRACTMHCALVDKAHVKPSIPMECTITAL